MEVRVGRLLALTAKAVRARFEAELAAEGASLATYVVLHDAVAATGLSQRELAERIGLEGPTLTRHLDRMEGEGLIVRRPDPADRRVWRIEPTTEGRRLYQRLRRTAERLEATMVAGLADHEVAALTDLLTRVRENMEAVESHAR
jgi:MarR family transcriptional regulator for hemolysin